MSSRAAAAACGGIVVVAIAVATLAARHAHPAEVSPVTPGGAWRPAWTAAVVLAVIAYAAGWLLTRRAALRLRVVVALAVVIQALPLAGPLLLSKDVYIYWAAARIAMVHHANPYVATINDYPNDVSAPYPSESFRGYPAAYGPAWETVGVLPGVAAGPSAHRAQLLYRIFAFVGIGLIVALLAWRRSDPAGVALVGWCPLVALHYAGGGHNDAWMMAFFAAALLAAETAAGGVAWAIAGSFKPVPVVLLPLELARTRFREARKWWIGVVAATLAISAVATALFGAHWLTEQGLSIHRGAGDQTPLGLVHWLDNVGLTHSTAALVAGALFVVVYILLFRDSWSTGRSRLALAAGALILTSALIRPWYGLWPLALAAVEGDLAGGAAAAALSGYLLLADAIPL